MENYDEVYRAVAFFISKYGRIDWLESNNEYWLEHDAMLRTDFHITSGFQVSDMPRIKFKSKMKEYYQKVGIATARYHMVDNFDGCKAFISEVGYPVIVKPDNGVGASHTYKLSSDDDLRHFLIVKEPEVSYIMEEFIHAEVNSYSVYYIVKDLHDDVRKAGRATVKSFGVRSRFVHFEFFRLTEDQPSMGKKGDVVALEVNMRPCGGFSPDMMNFANSTDVYKIWADMIAYDSTLMPQGEHAFCAFAGRRDGKHFRLSHEQLMTKYAAQMKMVSRVPDALSGAMGNMMYVANFPTEDAMNAFYADACGTV